MAACRLARLGPGCPVVDEDGACTIFYPEGVRAREERFGFCAFRNMRTPNLLAEKGSIRKRNPLKASKAKARAAAA